MFVRLTLIVALMWELGGKWTGADSLTKYVDDPYPPNHGLYYGRNLKRPANYDYEDTNIIPIKKTHTKAVSFGTEQPRLRSTLEVKCSTDRCKSFFWLWVFKGSLTVEMPSKPTAAVRLTLSMSGKTVPSYNVTNNGTLEVEKSLLPDHVAHSLRRNIEIRVNGLQLNARKVCVQVQAMFLTDDKWIKWPRDEPRCWCFT